MSPQEAEVTFWRHANAVTELDDGGADTPDLEPELLQLLQFVKAEREHQDLFKRLFITAATGEVQISSWIVLYCMRDLQYVEVQTAINNWFESKGGTRGAPRLMRFVSDVNWVYDHSLWEHADFFKYHWKREHPGEPWPCE